MMTISSDDRRWPIDLVGDQVARDEAGQKDLKLAAVT